MRPHTFFFTEFTKESPFSCFPPSPLSLPYSPAPSPISSRRGIFLFFFFSNLSRQAHCVAATLITHHNHNTTVKKKKKKSDKQNACLSITYNPTSHSSPPLLSPKWNASLRTAETKVMHLT